MKIVPRCAALLSLVCCGGAVSGAVRAAPPKPAPKPSSPGIVVCEPVPAQAAEAGFGNGCALWLQFADGGQPQFGQTPLWATLNRVAFELHRSNLQLSATQAASLASITGATHAAVGTLRGSGAHLSLTYRLLQVPSGTAVGAPVTLAGTRAQIDAKLPALARTLALRLGAHSPEVPPSTQLSPDDLQTLGNLGWPGLTSSADASPAGDLPESRQKQLAALTSRSPLAGLMALNLKIYSTSAARNAAAAALLAQVGGNPLAWGEIAEDPLALLPHAAPLAGLAARYPGSSILATAETFRFRAVQDCPGESAAAERVTQDAPHDPTAWLIAATAISDTAGDVRHGRIFAALSPEDAAVLSRLYPQQEAAMQRATALDPRFAAAWRRLAEAATFNSDSAAADHALQTALKLSADKAGAYEWGLEMYQPKWNDEPAKLSALAQRAAADTTLDADESAAVAQKLKSSGSPELRQALLNSFIARRREFISTHPAAGKSHWGLARVLEASGDKAGALTEYQAAAALLPGNADVRCDLGDALYRDPQGTSDQVRKQVRQQYQDAVRLDPDNPRCHLDLGFAWRLEDDFESAKRELRAAIALDPADGKAYSELGDVILSQSSPDYPAAIESYRAAIKFGTYNRQTYEQLVWALTQTHQYDQVIQAGNEALRIFINGDAPISDNMAEAYLHSKDWDKSIALDQATLASDANDAYARESLAEAFLGAGRIPEAQAEWRKVAALSNDQFKTIAQGYLKQYP